GPIRFARALHHGRGWLPALFTGALASAFRHAGACYRNFDAVLFPARFGKCDAIDCDLCLDALGYIGPDAALAVATTPRNPGDKTQFCCSWRQGWTGRGGDNPNCVVWLGADQPRSSNASVGNCLPGAGSGGILLRRQAPTTRCNPCGCSSGRVTTN